VTGVTVAADLELYHGTDTVRVFDEDGTLVVAAPRLRSLRALDALLDAVPGVAPATLADAGVTVEVRVRETPIARLGAGATPNLWGRLAGLDGAVSATGVLTVALRCLAVRR
jgi:hypothetical protein